MRKGKVGELYFEALPGYSQEVMIPVAHAKTRKEVMEYIEEHFDRKSQVILTLEYDRYRKIIFK